VRHARPVHFNRGRHGHIWACIACGRQIAGRPIPRDELEALIEFFKFLDQQPRDERKGSKMETEKIQVTVSGENRVELAARLRAFADNLDGKPAGKNGKVTGKTAKAESFDEDDAAEEAEVDADFDDSADEGEDFDGDADEPAPKKKKAKKLTVADVNAACKAYATSLGKTGFAKTKARLKKKFGTESISELDEEQWPLVIKLMAVAE
jgi:hypothetical protein